MSFLDRFRGRESRSAPIKSSDPYLGDWFGQRGGLGGHVDTARASGLATAVACVSIVSQAAASVPLKLYRRKPNGGRESADDHPLYAALHDQSNATMTAFEAREALIASLMINGNAYARLNWNGRGQVNELVPLDPSGVTVETLRNGRLRYRVRDRHGAEAVYLQEEILHLRWRLARDGVKGLSPIQLARETFNLALTQQQTAGNQAHKSFRPEGALVFPNMVNHQQREEILGGMEKKVASTLNTSGILVLDGGTDWKSFSFSSKDAEFLESRKLTNLDICRIWGVPPTAAGITDNATYSNVDQEARALVVRCLAPMVKRIEQAMNMALLTAESRKTLFIEHDLAGLMRGDMAARYTAYRTGRDGGWLSVNEIRGWENMPSIDGGDEFLSPLNMAPVDGRNVGQPEAEAPK